jgi:hypothetical protein
MTHWKKNLDSAFISGEDLLNGVALGKGLQPEMVVTLIDQKDAQTFDQNKQAKVTVTGLYFKDATGKPLYKPAILNKTNAKFFEKETGTSEMEQWYGCTVIMFAQKDTRHGHVVRFKRFVLPLLLPDSDQYSKAVTALKGKTVTLDQIKKKYQIKPEIETKLLEDSK